MSDLTAEAARMLEAYRKRQAEKKNNVIHGPLELEIRLDTGTYWDERLGRELTEQEVKQRKRQRQQGYGFDR